MQVHLHLEQLHPSGSAISTLKKKNKHLTINSTQVWVCVLPSDVNECEKSHSGCVEVCVSTKGSWRCECDRGRVMDRDGHSCRGIRGARAQSSAVTQHLNPVVSLFCHAAIAGCHVNNGGCSHGCSSCLNPYQCNCPRGAVLGEDKHPCQGVLQCVCARACGWNGVRKKKEELEGNQLTCRGELTQGNVHAFIWKGTHTCNLVAREDS